MAPTVDDADLGEIYRDSRLRLTELMGAMEADPAEVQVAACPGWSVHDVLAHLLAVAEDVQAGRLTGPPTDEQSAEQVGRRRGTPTSEVLEEWGEMGPVFEEVLRAVRVWPGALDVLAHEQDVRAAIGQPGARDTEGIRLGAEWFLGNLNPPVPMLVRLEDGQWRVGPGGADPLILDTDSFELFRFRLGRRSKAQMRAMRWTGDPSPVIDSLAVFGPSEVDIIE
jgi:uncharacterized protein (TIGR03083 family)